MVVLLFAMGFYLLEPKPLKLTMATNTPVEKLPISQWKQMVSQLNSDNYISQMRFQDGSWAFDILPNNTVQNHR